MKGECYHNKFSLTKPQCGITEVGYRPKIGNATDGWTWCKYHGGIVEDLPREEVGHEPERA